jgi:preprotein translocase subunit YajC
MFISPAYAQTAAGPSGGETALIQFLPLVFIFVIFYFLMIRPQQRRMKQHRAMIDAVKKGDTVVTAGGLIGKVSRVQDAEVEIELGPNVKVRAVKSTLSSVGAPTAANDATK